MEHSRQNKQEQPLQAGVKRRCATKFNSNMGFVECLHTSSDGRQVIVYANGRLKKILTKVLQNPVMTAGVIG